MPKLSPRSTRPNPEFDTDVIKSKFKLTANGVIRKRRPPSPGDDDDAPNRKSRMTHSSKFSSRETFESKLQSRNKPSDGESNFKTDWKSKTTHSSKYSNRETFKSKFQSRDQPSDGESNFKTDWKSKTTHPSKFSNRESFKSKLQSRNHPNDGESNFKTENKEMRMRTTRTDGKRKESAEAEYKLGDKPKRGRKRIGIRLSPYDLSNKRLDDPIPANETDEEKQKNIKEDYEKAELSKNAQFRAIMPSPSILAFVQENMLGRRREIEMQRAGYNIELPAPLDNIPFTTSTDRERIEESIFRNRLDFFAAAKISASFPPADAPEIAFAGRSNVGKSSLLNSLTRQWGVVRTSDKPGLTQTINFFNLGPKLNLVDLPGYGFAYAKEEVKDAWEELVKEYVSTRVGLKRVCLLIDTKWGMKPRDHELINLMERSQTKYQIVLTKTDIVFPMDVARRAMQIEESLKQNKSVVQPVMLVSSKSGAGIRSLRTVLAKVARFVKP